MIIQGQISEWTFDYDQIAIDGDILGDHWDWDDYNGKKIFVRYFICDEPIDNLAEAQEGLLRTFYGALESKGHPVFGSEWTGQYGYDQEFVVGGHDLVEELRTHVGKYVLIEARVEDDSDD